MTEKESFPSLSELLETDPILAELSEAMPDAQGILLWTFGAARVWGLPYPPEIQKELDRIHKETKKENPQLSPLDCLILNRLALDEEDF